MASYAASSRPGNISVIVRMTAETNHLNHGHDNSHHNHHHHHPQQVPHYHFQHNPAVQFTTAPTTSSVRRSPSLPSSSSSSSSSCQQNGSRRKRSKGVMEGQYPPHVLAQKFNNKGAMHLELGNVEKAIPYLAKALQLIEQLADYHDSDVPWEMANRGQAAGTATATYRCNASGGTCQHCQLETCMMASSQTRTSSSSSLSSPSGRDCNSSSFTSSSSRSSTTLSSPSKKRSLGETALPLTMSSKSQDGDDHDSSDLEEAPSASSSQRRGGYTYDQPLFVHSQCIEQAHHMGPNLSLLVVFNLALAYQLSHNLPKARRLYELCYQLQMEETPSSSLWFTMCLANNLSQVHQAMGDHTKYVTCLQHLLSTIMYMVDCQMASSMASTRGTPTASTADTLVPEEDQDAVGTVAHHRHMMDTVLDGFFRNASRIILLSQTAAAA